GLVIIAIVVLAFRQRKTIPATPLKLPLALLALVIFQGLLGMWTVTLGLFPTVVMAHLLGGFTTLCLLFLLALRLYRPAPADAVQPSPMLKWGIAGMIILTDRKSTRLNSSHVKISYAVFCLKKKNQPIHNSGNTALVEVRAFSLAENTTPLTAHCQTSRQ